MDYKATILNIKEAKVGECIEWTEGVVLWLQNVHISHWKRPDFLNAL